MVSPDKLRLRVFDREARDAPPSGDRHYPYDEASSDSLDSERVDAFPGSPNRNAHAARLAAAAERLPRLEGFSSRLASRSRVPGGAGSGWPTGTARLRRSRSTSGQDLLRVEPSSPRTPDFLSVSARMPRSPRGGAGRAGRRFDFDAKALSASERCPRRAGRGGAREGGGGAGGGMTRSAPAALPAAAGQGRDVAAPGRTSTREVQRGLRQMFRSLVPKAPE